MGDLRNNKQMVLPEVSKENIITEIINIIGNVDCDDVITSYDNNTISYSLYHNIPKILGDVKIMLIYKNKKKYFIKHTEYSLHISHNDIILFNFSINKKQYDNIMQSIFSIFDKHRERIIGEVFKNYLRENVLDNILD